MGKRLMIEQRSKAQGKRPEFCPIKRQRIVAGLLLAFVFFVNAIAGIAAREGGLAFLQHEKLAQSIVRNSSHWLREDIGSWHVFETNTWLVGRVRSHVGSLERSLSDFGYTSVREQVERGVEYTAGRYAAKPPYAVYFQAFTATNADVATLRGLYDEVLKMAEFNTVIIATRPDCLPRLS